MYDTTQRIGKIIHYVITNVFREVNTLKPI